MNTPFDRQRRTYCQGLQSSLHSLHLTANSAPGTDSLTYWPANWQETAK